MLHLALAYVAVILVLQSLGYAKRLFVRDQITLSDDSFSLEDVKAAAAAVGLDGLISSLPEGYDTPCSPLLFSQGQ